MFSIFQTKKKPPTYEETARDAFTPNNLFYDCLYQLTQHGYGSKKLLEFVKQSEEDDAFSKTIYLHAIRTNSELFTLNYQTRNYLKRLVETAYLLIRCRDIFKENSEDHSAYLLNKLVDVVYLLRELDDSLKKGVPMQFETIIQAVETLYQSLDEKLNEYYTEAAQPLAKEIIIAKQLRVEYQTRKLQTTHITPINIELEKIKQWGLN